MSDIFQWFGLNSENSVNDIIQWIGMLSGIGAVYLLYKNHIMTWPIGFINIGCFLWICWQERLYGDFAVNIMFLVVGIWGWIHWNYQSIKLPGILSGRQRIFWVVLTVLTIPLTFIYFKNKTDCSYPLLESAILNLSIVGQWLTAKRKFENWFIWIVADILMVIVYTLKGIYPFAIYAAIVLIIGIFGLLSWRKMLASITS